MLDRFDEPTVGRCLTGSTAWMAGLILMVADGRIAAVGDHARLMIAGGLHAERYEMQAAYR